MAYEFSRSNFPNSDFTIHTSRADEFRVVRQANSCDSILMGVIDLPKLLAVINSESSNLTIRPSRQNNLVSENSAVWIYTNVRVLSNASSLDRVVVSVPKSKCSVL
jgi:hypothetical protein